MFLLFTLGTVKFVSTSFSMTGNKFPPRAHKVIFWRHGTIFLGEHNNEIELILGVKCQTKSTTSALT